ncbi:GMC family oxidoreductase [Pseudomonas sp. GD03842]|uniref:GMC family oxidoreductase n=1 Tax=unclassified Pseudomonas TaxID=196821 RepID=UPI000D3C17BC|nr:MULTISPECIES: GMC family oxidoreductase [unclassified Pseudomonas]MDH0749817.1 GMC family oxidoreductase [Pseudomonas sp. GD03842]RAU39503.1 GMC family oxidoreductase [Pseudomonas sp. RIT 409]RAU55117.1 GMC family oxidoreductase [Pseudomonas sp. RIT 412]
MANAKPKVDAVIVGMGWTGAILAKELTDAGLNVVVLERGADRDTQPDFAYPKVVDELEGSVHRRYLQSLAQETVTARHNLTSTAVPYRQMGSFKPGTGVGGAGSHWSGCHFRALPEDFKLRSNVEQRYGAKFIPQDMTIQDFPVTYEDLEPHFDHFEYVCGTSGKAGVINGVKQVGGNPFEGSRSREFPLGPNPNYLGAELFYKGAREMGWDPYPIPASNASGPYVNPYGCQMGPCNACGFCSDYGCLNYSKASPNISILPVLRQRKNFELRTHAQVLKVNLDNDGKKATGVTYLDAQGREVVQEADLVLLCAFSLYNVHLMLLSGIGKPYDPQTGEGTVGRNYSYQNLNRVVLFFNKDVQANQFIGIGGAGTTMDNLNGNQLDNAKAGFVGGGIVWARQPGAGPVRGINVPPGTPNWGTAWKQAASDAFRHSFYFEVQGACMSYKQHYLSLDPTYKDGFGRPLLRMTFDWHDNEIKASQFLVGKALEMSKVLNPTALSGDAKKPGEHYNITKYQSTHTCGGAIMGSDPKTSALNRYLQSWDVHNVFAIGANAFPQNNGYNPTGMVGALAYWSAKAIREQYLKNPGPLVQA